MPTVCSGGPSGMRIAEGASKRCLMENTVSPPVSDAAKSASRGAQRLGKDVKDNFADAVSRGSGAFLLSQGSHSAPLTTLPKGTI